MQIPKEVEIEINKEISKTINTLSINKKIDNLSFNLFKIIESFYFTPWVEQKDIFKSLSLRDKSELLFLNKILRDNSNIQEIITKKSPAKKYWNTIVPFAERSDDVIQNNFRMPLRIAIFPGLSCMFYCGFCGRNQKAKYPSSSVGQSVENFRKLFNQLDKNTKISISGGLEPFTNNKIGEIINHAAQNNFKIPLITNGYNLTKSFLDNNKEIWNLDSIRISLYGYDEDSYIFITRNKKSYSMVKNNLIELLSQRNLINKSLKVGLNFIVLNENMHHLNRVLDFIYEVNSSVKNGEGINFLTMRDDYHSVTGHNDNLESDRLYKIKNTLNLDSRKKLISIINEFDYLKKKKCPDLHVDYGYSLEFLRQGFIDNGLKKIEGNLIRPYGFTQLSVAIDTYGDVFLFREAGFLDRKGNNKVIIGRLGNATTLESIIKNFLNNNNPIKFYTEDTRFLDSFDHVLNVMVNQVENNNSFGVTIDQYPIKFNVNSHKKLKKKVNNWYSDDI